MIAALAMGGAVGADRTAFGQTLLAHPAIAASLAGWWAGAPQEGIWLGLVLGLLSFSQIPVGAERLRDWSSVAVAIPFAVGPGQPGWIWGSAVCIGALLAPLGGGIIAAHRELALRAYQRLKAPPVGERALERAHFLLGALHFVRGAVVVLLFVAVIRALVDALSAVAPGSIRETLALLWALSPLLGAGALLSAARRDGASWLVVGVVLGVGVALWRGWVTWS